MLQTPDYDWDLLHCRLGETKLRGEKRRRKTEMILAKQVASHDMASRRVSALDREAHHVQPMMASRMVQSALEPAFACGSGSSDGSGAMELPRRNVTDPLAMDSLAQSHTYDESYDSSDGEDEDHVLRESAPYLRRSATHDTVRH